MRGVNRQKPYYSFRMQGGNQVWSATMPLVWRQVRNDLAHQDPLVFHGASRQAQNIIKALNQSDITSQILSEDNYYLKCGFGQRTVKLINRQVKKKFGLKKALSLDEQLGDKDFISYAYIYKSVQFINKFERRRDRSFRFNGERVDSLYARYLQQKQQIKCYFYEGPGSFLIQIRLKNNTGCLFFIKNQKVKTVKNAINTVLTSVQNKQPFTLAKTDQFQMPLINISGLKQYEQMKDLQFKNKELQGYRIKKMYQQFRLQINECGAILQGSGVLVSFNCASKLAKPREFLLDSSFWVVMQEQNQHPYFCAFIQKVTS